MLVFYDNVLTDEKDLDIAYTDRAFMYGDGLFETIVVRSGKIRFLNYHISRLLGGMEALRYEKIQFDDYTLRKQIEKLIKSNGHQTECRIKLQVWRDSKGLYTPEDNRIHMLLSSGELQEREKAIKSAAIARQIQLHYSPYSAFKTCNSLPYILAGLEKKERGLNELILLDYRGYLSECTSTNLFWSKNNKLYTPAISTGCIAGIMRRHLIKQADLNGRSVIEIEAKPDVLSTAEQVFACNVTGIYYFEEIEGIKYSCSPDLEIAQWASQE